MPTTQTCERKLFKIITSEKEVFVCLTVLPERLFLVFQMLTFSNQAFILTLLLCLH